MPDKITIDLTDLTERVQHGYNLTNDEARWLLGQIGQQVPRVNRCNECHGEGSKSEYTYQKYVPVKCEGCNGKGYLPQPEPEYEVRQ